MLVYDRIFDYELIFFVGSYYYIGVLYMYLYFGECVEGVFVVFVIWLLCDIIKISIFKGVMLFFIRYWELIIEYIFVFFFLKLWFVVFLFFFMILVICLMDECVECCENELMLLWNVMYVGGLNIIVIIWCVNWFFDYFVFDM